MKSLNKIMLAVVTASAAFSANAAHVLVVLSDEAQLELKKGHIFKTGFYLNELMQPTKMLLDAGHTVTFATPKGKAPTLDESSNNVMYFNQDEKALKQYADLLHDLKLTSAQDSPVVSLSRIEQIGVGQFDAIYIPGGHAPMQDLLKDNSVHDKFHRTLILSGFCFLKIAKISLNSSFFQNQLNAESPFEHSLNHSEINSLRVVHASLFLSLFFDYVAIHPLSNTNRSL
ncbi:thiJ/PfpI family domain protein [Acinetobacter sp. 1295259]|nr:thiJ/PfpI family domain protein [Acinetobacter sp. 1295259]